MRLGVFLAACALAISIILTQFVPRQTARSPIEQPDPAQDPPEVILAAGQIPPPAGKPEYTIVEVLGKLESRGDGRISIRSQGRQWWLTLPPRDRVLEYLASNLAGKTVVVKGYLVIDAKLDQIEVQRIEPVEK